ncbi:MAG: hypothetical protein N4A61_00970 [Pelagimonas sp.]|jgi:hypothetical protein|nr:hypothetical protein [Pelagimonas sp.]
MRKPVFFAVLTLGVLAAPLHAEQHTITIIPGGYFPEETHVMQGDTIRFENASGVQMTATATDGSWTTGVLNDGDAALITVTASIAEAYRNTAPSTYVVDGIDTADARGRLVLSQTTPGLPGETDLD